MRRFISASLFALAAFACGACSTPDTGARVDPVGPDKTTFGPVAQMLERRCGSLDCHGETHRNMRLYGYGGLRRAPTMTPEQDMTAAETDADYDSVIALEPEKMADVVRERGTFPDRLTLVRKGRGTEDHKGGTRITPGDDADICLTTWLASATNTAACLRTLDER